MSQNERHDGSIVYYIRGESGILPVFLFRSHVYGEAADFYGSMQLWPIREFQLSDSYNMVVKIRDSWWRDWSLVAPEVLYRRSKWTTPIRDWKIGDVVYYSADQKIGNYQLAKIVECISEPDNLVRSVIVEYTSGKNNKKRTRPVSTASLILIAPSGYTLNEVGEYSPSFNEAWEEDTMAEGRIKDLEKEGN